MNMAEYRVMSLDFEPANDGAQQRSRQQLGSACEHCRKKKLRCDRKKPQCLACANAGISCIVREDASPRGPKKGHVNALRNKIADLEARVQEQESRRPASRGQPQNLENDEQSSNDESIPQIPIMPSVGPNADLNSVSTWLTANNSQLSQPSLTEGFEDAYSNLMLPVPDQLPVGALLNPLVCSDLDQLYFERVHVFAPILQKARYLSWSRQFEKPNQKLCLQYSMWSIAACLSSQFQMMGYELYLEARRLLDTIEVEFQDNCSKCIEQPQAWLLLSIYELITDRFQRCLASVGRACRLVQLMRLYEIDRHPQVGLQGDWVDEESLRRTFWLAYNLDHFTSVVTGFPITLSEREIGTRLPAPESNFMSGQPTVMCFLSEFNSGNISGRASGKSAEVEISPFAEFVLMSTIYGRAMDLKQRSVVDYGSHGMTQEFFRKLQSVNTLLMARLHMLSRQHSTIKGHPDAISMFLVISAHAVNLMLCESREAGHIGEESPDAAFAGNRQRAMDAASELNILIPQLAQLNHFEAHPFTPIPLLVSARFCQSHLGMEDSYSALIPIIESALQGLVNVNGLVKEVLRLLDMGIPNAF